jgi:plasmid stabilization system protein ParE
MKRPLRLLPEARIEFDDGVDWYDARQAGLGARFLARVREVFDRIRSNPRMHGAVHQDVRKAVVCGFPYVVLYQEDSHEVIVIAVFHTSRDPADWKGRV